MTILYVGRSSSFCFVQICFPGLKTVFLIHTGKGPIGNGMCQKLIPKIDRNSCIQCQHLTEIFEC
uniref:Uncharacterized protein n=1 Tax=Arundo donax TaxID=35708 RepID=A0A0A9DRI6_ARUDO